MTSFVSRLLRAMAPVGLLVLLAHTCLYATVTSAQFVDEFDSEALSLDPRALQGWAFFSGDGTAEMSFTQREGSALLTVNARQDTLNIWWALIKRAVSSAVDTELLSRPGYELRIEARVRPSVAPRRINLHANTGRTTDFHSHLMEYDLPDTAGWHTVSMTTRGFDAVPGDTVYAQLALMDWGIGRYQLEIDYFRVNVVEVTATGPDLGEPIPYHPPVSDPSEFPVQLVATEFAMVDTAFATLTFGEWRSHEREGPLEVVTVGGSLWVVLRWDLSASRGRKVRRSGLLALPTHSVLRARHELPELGQIRVAEILGGDSEWRRETVTFTSLTRGEPADDVFNPQMIIDVDVEHTVGDTAWVTIPRPVLQRLIDGRTHGLLLRPLGPIQASFHADGDAGNGIRLLFEVE